MSVTIAGISLPDPVECIPGLRMTGTLHRACDSTPDYAYVGSRPVMGVWRVKWDNLTYQEYRLVCDAYQIALQGATTWTPPEDGATYPVRAIDDFAPSPSQGFLRLACGFTLEEV